MIKIPFYYWDGNNKIIDYRYRSEQTKKIKYDKQKKVFEVEYIDTKSPIGIFSLRGELINKCAGDWIVNLTNEEIEALIPPDYRENKEEFKRIALNIIQKYDEEHRDDLFDLPNATIIGKWVYKNITYFIDDTGRNEKTAMETYNTKKGVCHHKTKLFNALMYSLGYKVLYVLGYAIDKIKSFCFNDLHAWSLIKINGKWVPFDVTWGIFTGKLPVTHVFKKFDYKLSEKVHYDLDKKIYDSYYVEGKLIQSIN